MKFYTKKLNQPVPVITTFPCFVLVETTWDDYGYKTNFILNYYKNSRNKIEIGETKILKRNEFITSLPLKFSKLRKTYCSLGQSNGFYTKIQQKFDSREASRILNSLNDIIYNKEVYDSFRSVKGLRESLLRSSEALKAFQEVAILIDSKEIKFNFHLNFSTQISTFQIPHEARFSFRKKGHLSKRLGAIIGKNGSGKTQYLARLGASLSGSRESGSFPLNGRPRFSRVIAISYTLFDQFEKPSRSSSKSYFFCGFQSEKEFDSFLGLERRFKRAITEVNDQNRTLELEHYLEVLLGKDFIEWYKNAILNNELIFSDNNRQYSKLSSGQTILLIVLTEILGYIKEDSILLFDEPETHLHPNAISQFIGILHEILIKHDSFAIIATHSAQIVQEIPSSLIYYFDNNRANPPVSQISYETFGENLTVLTEKIFQTIDVDEYYKKFIEAMVKEKNYTKDQLLKLFEREKIFLSMNARIFIEYLILHNAKP